MMVYDETIKEVINEFLNDFSSGAGIFTVFMVISVITSLITTAVATIIYFLRAIGVYEMSASSGFKNPWYSFIPFFNSYALGRIAENYKKKNGTKSAKFSIILLTLHISMYATAIITAITCFSSSVRVLAELVSSYQSGGTFEVTALLGLIPAAVVSVLFFGLLITYYVVYFICYWRTCSAFDYKNATLYTVLSVIFDFLGPIFLFVIRKNKPAYEYNERMGQFVNKY